MRKITTYILFATLAIVVTSCLRPTVKMTSYTHPSYFQKRYNKVCILVEGRTLQERKVYENLLVESFVRNGTSAIEGSVLFPPMEDWTEEYYNSVLNKNGFDAFLLVTLTEEVVRDELIPRIVTETRTKVDEDTTKKDTKTRTTVSTQRETERILEIDMQMQMKIIDVKNNQVSWQGESIKYPFGMLSSSQFRSRIRYLANDLVYDLQNKKHLVLYD